MTTTVPVHPPLDEVIAMFGGWVMVSDAIDPEPWGPEQCTIVHHWDGCHQSNGRSQLRLGRLDELAQSRYCSKCLLTVGPR